MSNLIINYLHRDEGNWQDHLSVCVQNPAGYTPVEAEKTIRGLLIDREFFYPEKVGLSRSNYAASSDWHELDCVMADDESVDPLDMTLETLLEKLDESNKFYLKPIKVHKVPARIPIRLAVSWLEFLRETRQALDETLALLHKNSVVMVFKSDSDCHIIEDTLRLDCRSGNFDRDLRRSIERALNGAKEICDLHSIILCIRQRSSNIQKRIQKAVGR